jgi:hypothetical protein
MPLPPRGESRRQGLEILSLFLYEGIEPAARLLNGIEDPEMVYAITCYYLKALGEYITAVEWLSNVPVANQLERMGKRILATDEEEEEG